jgi:hypothetical protein
MCELIEMVIALWFIAVFGLLVLWAIVRVGVWLAFGPKEKRPLS